MQFKGVALTEKKSKPECLCMNDWEDLHMLVLVLNKMFYLDNFRCIVVCNVTSIL